MGGGDPVEVVEVEVMSTEPRGGVGLPPLGSVGKRPAGSPGFVKELVISVVVVEVVEEVEEGFRGSGAEVAVMIEESVEGVGLGLGEEVEPIIVVLDVELGKKEGPGIGPRRDIANEEKARRRKSEVCIILLERRV